MSSEGVLTEMTDLRCPVHSGRLVMLTPTASVTAVFKPCNIDTPTESVTVVCKPCNGDTPTASFIAVCKPCNVDTNSGCYSCV